MNIAMPEPVEVFGGSRSGALARLLLANILLATGGDGQEVAGLLESAQLINGPGEIASGLAKRLRKNAKAKASRQANAEAKESPAFKPVVKLLEDNLGRALRFPEVAQVRSLLKRWAGKEEAVVTQVTYAAMRSKVDQFYVPTVVSLAGRGMAVKSDTSKSTVSKEWKDEQRG